ncbi:PoNe immunity protein domain-containing protein [Ralstonia nicotianae]|nr:DUF1911 domain-containing protein [Ralstonia solanacearum]
MAFNDIRRQRFLSAAHAEEFDADLKRRIESDLQTLAEEDLAQRARRSFAWSVASDSFERLILHYTAGKPVQDLKLELPSVIALFDAFVPVDKPRPNEAYALEITQLEAYVYVLWLLALCKLLGHDVLIPKIIEWIDRNAERNRGRDGLFESVVQKLLVENKQPERVLLHPDAYRSLARATVSAPEERPGLIEEFLDGWYRQMKPCYWHGTHTDKEGSSYFGYWAFEAALVTVLWDIDDSSYRDHLVYPKDLVDWYRSHASVAPENTPPRTPAEQPCPKEGWWFTPAAAGSRRHFEQGEIMPEVQSDYGSTFWQWDSDQSGPKL